MKKKNLCLDCKLAIWIRCKADLGRLPKAKRKELAKQLAKARRDHGVELSEIIFPFIWCPKWKKEVLFPHHNNTLACKYFNGKQEAIITPQQRLQLKSQLAERTKVRRRKEEERRQHIYK